MSELDRRVKRAFDEVKAPEEAKRQTLSFIEGLRPEAKVSKARLATGADEPVASRDPGQGTASASEENLRRRGRFHARRTRRALLACAACLAMLAVCWGGYRLYAQPTAYVGIDVNPSVELSVNRFGLVVEARGINDDGRALLAGVSLVNRGYGEALTELTRSDAFASYVQENAFVEINVASDDERQSQELYAQSSEGLSTLPCEGSCHRVDAATRDSAAASGMGMGRYRAAAELMELDPDVTLDECAHMSMRQLRDRVAACRHAESEEGEAGTDAAQGKGNGMGQGQGHRGGTGSAHGRGAGRGCDEASGQQGANGAE